MSTITCKLPCYPADKELFPAFHDEAQEWRESTTFCNDFCIAEHFGIPAVRDTFNRAFKAWKTNAKYMVEICAVSNNLLWNHYNKGNEELSRVYDEFYKKCYEHIFAADENGHNISPFTDEEVKMMYLVLD